ncbi:MAG: BON domain-containing protein [Candidatus Kapaibacterium sp.]
MMKQLWKLLALGFLLLSLPACNGSGSGDVGRTLDSAGQKLKEAGREIGGKLDTAAAGIKTEMNESQMQAALNRFTGLENVKLNLSGDGVATLTGDVATVKDRQSAEEMTSKMNHVSSVVNQINVGGHGDTTRVRSRDTATGGNAAKKQ